MTGHRRPAVIEQLRARIAAIDKTGPGEEEGYGRPVLAFGQPVIDAALPWSGLPLGCLHEIVGQGDRRICLGFRFYLCAPGAVRQRRWRSPCRRPDGNPCDGLVVPSDP